MPFKRAFDTRGRVANLLVLIVLMLVFVNSGFANRARELVFDTMQVVHWHLFGDEDPKSLTPRVWVVGIDDASIAANTWPFPRIKLADLIERVGASGMSAIGLDIFFPNASPSIGDDDWLTGSIANTSGLVLAHPLGEILDDDTPIDQKFAAPISSESQAELAPHLIPSQAPLVPNFGDIDQFAAGHGFINDDWFDEFSLRKMPLLVIHGEVVYAAFSAELARLAHQARYAGHMHNGDLHALKIVGPQRSLFLPLDDLGSIRPQFRPADLDRLVSAQDVLDAELDLPFSKGDIVIIGATALGAGDLAWTAFGEMAGVEIHAQILDSILAEKVWWHPPFAPFVEWIAALLFASIMLAFAPLLRLSLALALYSALCASLLIMTLLVMIIGEILIDPVPAILAASIVFLGLYASRIVIERARRRTVENQRLALETEMVVARDIQNSILARTDQIKGLPASIHVEAKLVQSNFVGGDFFDIFMIDQERLFIIVADVSGKGWSGAFFMAIAKAFIQSFAMADVGGPGKIAALAEREIMRSNPNDLFVTAIIGILDVRTGVLDLCNAGHPPPIVIAGGEPCKSLECAGAPPIGMVPGFEFQSSRHQLRNGDSLFLYTDGLADLTDTSKGNSIGDLRHFLDQQRDGRSGMIPAQTVVERAIQNGNPAEDDITVMMVRYA